MKKLISTFIAGLLLCFTAAAQNQFASSRFELCKGDSDFDVLYYLAPDMTVYEAPDTDDLSVTQAFKLEKDGISGLLKYTLFKENPGDEATLSADLSTTIIMCLYNAAGYEVDLSKVGPFSDADVKAEFNGTCGWLVFLTNPVSAYAENNKYLMMEFFYRENQGLVVRSFLFNDLAFAGINPDYSVNTDALYYTDYHTFRFMEKDADGKYIEQE